MKQTVLFFMTLLSMVLLLASPSQGDYGSTYNPTYTIPTTIPDGALYVDQNHVSANDSNPCTAALPCKTIVGGLSKAVSGSTVVVKAGIYYEEPQILNASNITLMAAPNERVIVSAMKKFSQSDWTFYKHTANGDI
jgi:hypothetical protein